MDYLRIEDAYVASVKQLLRACKVETLEIRELEDRRELTIVEPEISGARPAAFDGIHDGCKVHGDDIDEIVRMNLREVIWCKLSGPNATYIHFGHDLYLYIGCDCVAASLGSPPQGMFYEELESPYK